MKTVSVIVPVYFNEKSLEPLFRRLTNIEDILRGRDVCLELIFVDDGSKDGSLCKLLQLREARPSTRVIRLSRNFGAVHASKCGLNYVTGDCFLILAADLQDPPELILDMVAKWQQGSKFTICVRRTRHDPPISRLLSSVFYLILRIFVLRAYPRTGFDLALLDSSLLPYIVNSSKRLYTPLLAFWLGFTPDVIYYDRQLRRFGKSRWSFTKKLDAALDILLGFSVTPLRFVTFLGLIVAITSFIYASSVILSAIHGKIPVPGFATTVSIVCLLSGFIIVMTGLIGEYLWRIYEELNKRPEVIIDSIY